MSNELIASTNVKQKGAEKYFRISTINRPSSAVEMRGDLYAETMVWEWDNRNGEFVGAAIWQGEATAGSIRVHFDAVASFYLYGEYRDSAQESAK